MKRIGFFVEGLSNLKMLGPLFQRAEDFDIVPVAFMSRSGGGKVYDIVTPELLTQYFVQIKPADMQWYGDRPIIDLVQANDISAVVVMNTYRKYSQDIVALAEGGIPTYDLDYFVNPIYTAACTADRRTVKTSINHLTTRLVTNTVFRDLELSVNPDTAQQAGKYLVTGTPLADIFPTIDRRQARQLLGIPEEKKIICVLTPNIRKHHANRFYGWRSQTKLERVIRILKKLCQQSGHALVIKSRDKQWDSDIYHRYADYFISDRPELVYPHASALLLSNCELLVHFGSMGVMEAAAANVPSLGIEVAAVDKLHDYMEPRARQIIYDAFFAGQADSLFAFAGVSEAVSIHDEASHIIETAQRLINDHQNNSHRYHDFRQKFLHSSDTSATTAILNHVVAACTEREKVK